MKTAKRLSILGLPSLVLLAAFAPIPSSPGIDSPMVMAADNSTTTAASDNNADNSSTDNADNAVVAPDNSTVNQRDRSASAVTADQGKNNANDRDVMQKIRKAVVADKSLSTYGHNVKIISRNGKVTLKGPVASDQEKQDIEAKAIKVAGDGNVTDKISVMSAN